MSISIHSGKTKMIEKEVIVESDGNSLAGTLCLPENMEDCPVVLMVHGSGPLDRNENSKHGELNIFNTLSAHLLNEGIGTLRYDKRGCAKSTGDYYTTGHMDLVADANAWVEYIKGHTLTAEKKIYVLGHSEGAVIAPQVFANHESITGIILLCPFVQNFESILIRQAVNMQKDIDTAKGFRAGVVRLFFKVFGNLVNHQKKLIKKLKSSQKPTLRYWFIRISSKWFRELMELDTEAVYKKVTCPALLIGGAKDLQCDPGDVEEIRKLIKGEATCFVMDDLTHILRIDEEPPAYSHYQKLLKKPLEPQVPALIAAWLKPDSQGQSVP